MTKYADPTNPPPHVPLWDNEGDRWEPNAMSLGRPVWVCGSTQGMKSGSGAFWIEMMNYAPFSDVDPHADHAELRAEEMTGPQHFQAANELLDLYADARRGGGHSPDAPILAIAHALQGLTAAVAAVASSVGGVRGWREVLPRG